MDPTGNRRLSDQPDAPAQQSDGEEPVQERIEEQHTGDTNQIAHPEQTEQHEEPQETQESEEAVQHEEPQETQETEEAVQHEEPQETQESEEAVQHEEPQETQESEEAVHHEEQNAFKDEDTELSQQREGHQVLNVEAEVNQKEGPRDEVEELPEQTVAVPTNYEEEVLLPKQPSRSAQAEVGEDGLSSPSALPTTDAGVTLPSTPAPTAAADHNVSTSVPQQAPNEYIMHPEVDVAVDATVHPMGFRIVVKAPGSPGGVVATRFLFESVSSRLGTHPEVIKLLHNGERIRFGETVTYEQETAPGKGRLWIDVYFIDDKVPLHLQSLSEDDNLLRCVRVRSRLESVRPADLVAARRRGLTLDDALRELRNTTKSENIITLAILQDSKDIRPPFLGGYRSKKDHSHVFLHAATQLTSPGDTSLAKLLYGPLPRDGVSKKTQTYGVSRSCQTLRECTTQTARPDYEVDERYDEVVIAKPYFSAVQLLDLQSEKAVVIQKMYRKWKARKIYRELYAARQAFLDGAAAQAAAEEAEKQRREEFERRRRATPHTADDFATLRRELEAWRAAEASRILSDKKLSEMEKRSALADLTKKELQLLQELETLRRGAIKNRRARRFEDILALMTSAKQCGKVMVTTQAAERARELRQLYLALTETPSSVEARLDVLLHVKWTVKEFDVPLTREIVELVDRESDLLQRGRTASSLKGLRTRLENLFKRFIATPEYNPAVDEVVKGPIFGVVSNGEAASTTAASRRLKPSNVS
ncbi:uncharacterized protein TM35_000191860 [Trypanosoma theileri]|uniref:IQ motif and ubiquitin-like domain-containing protein n=1 Tax=Trypanosoma theileri TaxID=67003 RepID=A0A1X0NTC7_9TRYP|nr:uncharacterized protein TM35_000191860 [Trypanosoma theileri]ORC87942.1 hypothetical protein TM35_000191860 [Trypanosoma theileri]